MLMGVSLPCSRASRSHKPIRLSAKCSNSSVIHAVRYELFEFRARLSKTWFWFWMDRDVEKFCRFCHICQVLAFAAPFGLSSTVIYTKPFLRVALDCVCGLPASKRGNTAIMTCVCLFTDYWITCPIRSENAEDVLEAFLVHVCCKEGYPREVLSDKGPAFLQVFPQVTERLGIGFGTISSFRAAANRAERPHQDLNRGLRGWALEQGHDNWEPLPLSLLTFTRNYRTKRGSVFLLFFVLAVASRAARATRHALRSRFVWTNM